MNITVRLYKLHDFDLIYLYKNLRFPVRDAMKEALEAYVRETPVFFRIPIACPDSEQLTDIKNAQFHIKLDSVKDADLIYYLSKLKKYYRNSFLKNLLRGYLAGPATYVYEEVPDLPEQKEKYKKIEDRLLNVKTVPLLKKRNKRKRQWILTRDQKKLIDFTGILEDETIQVILRDPPSKETDPH